MLSLLLLVTSCVPVNSFRDAGPTQRIYTLAFGDSLWGVAMAYDVPGGYPALARANGIRNPDYVLAGDKLRVDTRDTTLPEVARISAGPTMAACAMAPVPVRTASLSGCDDAACVDTGRGGAVCACGGDDMALVVTQPGRAAVGLPIVGTDPFWFAPDAVIEPARSARSLVGVRVQLDGDPALETVVSWRTHTSDVGLTHGTALVVDDDGTPGAQFRADNFGVGSLLQSGSRCDVLATEWEDADEPRDESVGWYLGGRRFRHERGELIPVATSPVVMRRLLYSFTPAVTMLGGARVGAPAVDLGPRVAFARSTEPRVEAPLVGVQNGTLRGLRREGGQLLLDIDGAEQMVEAYGDGVRWVGDARAGVLYPSGYLPAGDASLRGRPVQVKTYATTWGGTFSVAWVGTTG